jgi:multidrug efflux system outer membrane protein
MPKYERPTAPVAAAYPEAVHSNGLASTGDRSWRSVFSDPRLVRLIEAALAGNADLKVAMLNVEKAQAQYRVQKAEQYPTVDAGLSYNNQRAEGLTTKTWAASVGTTSYELDLFGRVRSLNAQALETYFATEDAQRAAQIALVASVATEYYTLRELEQQEDVAKSTLQTVRESYQLNQRLFEAGELTELDLRTSEGQVRSAEVDIAGYWRQIAQSRDNLVLLIGCPLPDDLLDPRPLDEPIALPELPTGLPSELLERRADVREAEHTLKAANANIGVARAAFFPSVTLTASGGESSGQFSQLFTGGSAVWAFSPQLTLPLFTGGANRANLDAAKIGTAIEFVQYRKAIQTAFREVSDALASRAGYRQQAGPQQALVATLQRRYELANVRYRQGADTYLNVLSAQQDLYTAQQAQVQIRFDVVAADISLYEALGGGWQ